jgi:DNA-binding XRE family transcriptional regulator
MGPIDDLSVATKSLLELLEATKRLSLADRRRLLNTLALMNAVARESLKPLLDGLIDAALPSAQPANQPDDLRPTVGEIIKRLRLEKGRSQIQIAKAARMNLGTYRRIETGRAKPQPRSLIRLAKAFQTDVADLLPSNVR